MPAPPLRAEGSARSGYTDRHDEETTGVEEGMAVPDVATNRAHRPTTAAAARDHVRHLLTTGVGPPPSETAVNDILLVTSELVTNALRHGGGVTRFHAALDAHAIRISVTDRSPVLPRTTPRDGAAVPGGYGWPLIQRLSTAITITAEDGGKTITVVVASR
ncbi:ATP-binding protein [Streptomyces roseolilacinus]|uniref:ATP-binding protein n=1 Tax=Streptomyces roseolilacinus TaxID=66904 RepID=A0A918AWX6_9ACTN|nr:ATP-binding protein [Streptomyces roseolilacinus]GGP96091.1 ATP-binding protein [Streptomyces roseolilacinus]